MFNDFDVREVPGLEAFAGMGRYGFASTFRSNRPVLLVCPVRSLPWVVIVRAAPIDHALLCAEVTNQWFDGETGEWAGRQLAQASVRRRFFRELEASGFALDAVPVCLMDNMDGRGGVYFRGRSINLSRFGPDLGRYRVRGDVWPTAILDHLLDYFNARLREAGPMAFHPADEADDRIFPVAGMRPWFPVDDALLFAHPLSGPTPLPFQLEPLQRQAWLQEAIRRSQAIVDHLESGGVWEHAIHYTDLFKIFPAFPVRDALTAEGDADLRLFRLRAKLVRLLGWPQMYWSVVNLGEWARSELDRPVAATAAIEGRVAGFREALGELDDYLQDMLRRYPLLTASHVPEWLAGTLA